MSARRLRALKIAVLLATGAAFWQLMRPHGDPRIVGSWRHAEPAWNETYRFDANGLGVTSYEGERERQFRWWVEDERVVIRYFFADRIAILPTYMLDLWDRLSDDVSMSRREVWEPMTSGSPPIELVRPVPLASKSNPLANRSYRRVVPSRY